MGQRFHQPYTVYFHVFQDMKVLTDPLDHATDVISRSLEYDDNFLPTTDRFRSVPQANSPIMKG